MWIIVWLTSMLMVDHIPTLYVEPGRRSEIDLTYFVVNTAVPKSLRMEFSEHIDAITISYDTVDNKIIVYTRHDWCGLTHVRFKVTNVDGDTAHGVITLRARKLVTVTFRYYGKPGSTVYLAGEFNDWNPNLTHMRDDDHDGIYEVELKLPIGVYQYKFVVDGRWIHDEHNPDKRPDGFGGYNSVLNIGGKVPILIGETKRIHGDTLQFEVRFDNGRLDPQTISVVTNNRVLKGGWQVRGNLIDCKLTNLSAGKHWFKLNAANTDGIYANELYFEEYIDVEPQFDWRDAIIYYVIIDRFCNGDTSNDEPVEDVELSPKCNYQGGDLIGIIHKLREGYFDSLGINVLWISPVYQGPDSAYRESFPPYRKYTGYHGYWPVHPTKVEHRFGDMHLLRQLVELAHQHGIRVMLDLVLNHVHEDHPWYKRHPEWFTAPYTPDGRPNLRLFDEFPLTTWFDTFLPAFDFTNPEVIDTVVSNAIFWIKQTGADAVRLDAVKHIPHEVWRYLRKRIREEIELQRGEHFYLVGETIWGREKLAEYVKPEELDGQFDYPLYWCIRDVFAYGTRDMVALANELMQSYRIYGGHAIMSVFIGNQDFARFITYADGLAGDEKEVGWQTTVKVSNPNSYKKLQLAITFIMTVNSVPMIFYGDEFGMPGAGDPDNRRVMRFGDELTEHERQTLQYIRKVVQLRRRHPSLRKGVLKTLVIEPDVWVYLKQYFNDKVIVGLNRGGTPKTMRLELTGRWVDYFTGDTLSGNVETTIPAIGTLILEQVR